MTKILFIQELAQFHIGTAYLRTVLRKGGHECEVLIASIEKDLLKEIKIRKPDVLAFSVITGTQKWALDIAKRAKKVTNCKVIFGGPHPTFFPKVINYPQVDYICIGEGEYPLLDLADRLQKNEPTDNIQNLWCKKGKRVIKNPVRCLIQNLDELPFPERDLYDRYPLMKKYNSQVFITTRGCPYLCSFCFNHALKKIYDGKGRYVRRRSVKNVIEELKAVKEAQGLDHVYFQDDTFVLDKKWLLDFLKEYKREISIPFMCLARANLLDEQLVRALKAARCRMVAFGIETGNEELRNNLLKKSLYNKDIIRCAKLLKKYKIKFRTYNMLGLPDETLENAFETLQLNALIKTDYPWCSIFQPYAGTELGEYAIKRGYLSSDFNPDDVPLYYSKSIMQNKKDINQIINLQRFFIVGVKFPFLIPLIKKLIKLPPNKFYELIFVVSYGYITIRCERVHVLDFFWEGLKIAKNSFFSKK
jgi:anaerobic magnesium-protoporphyrin IX monomethyl ester cyclase